MLAEGNHGKPLLRNITEHVRNLSLVSLDGMRIWVQLVRCFDFLCMEHLSGRRCSSLFFRSGSMWLADHPDHSTQVSLAYVVRRHIGLDVRRLLVSASKPRCCWWSSDHNLWIMNCSIMFYQEMLFHQISNWPWYQVLSYFSAGLVHDMTHDTSDLSFLRACSPW